MQYEKSLSEIANRDKLLLEAQKALTELGRLRLDPDMGTAERLRSIQKRKLEELADEFWAAFQATR